MKHTGVQAGLLAAILFGAGTPVAKMLLDDASPWMLAGLLYIGSGVGLGVYRVLRRSPRVRLARREMPYLAGAILFGGVLGPVLLLVGLSNLPASGASLLLNAEAVLTAVIAWVVFREHVSVRTAVGMLVIVAGAAVLTVPSGIEFGSVWPSLAVIAACLCWAVDNNLTRAISHVDAVWTAAVKGGVAGPVNLALALLLGASLPAVGNVLAAMGVGLFAYGVSLVLFIVSMRHVGTARAGAYFSIAPFFGAALAVGLGEPVTVPLAVAATLMGLGVWLHVTERHSHLHTHEAITHEHMHTHDEHHQHHHDEPIPAGTRHSHPHTHEAITHEHPHFPDAHHRHRHRH
ncbi:DMT family transporter [Microbacterium sp.]|uniref:DMT family transporter n=1 Tax=Microbacterium sp. TaxID=51671 RepID=UPI0037C91A18